MCTGFAGTHHSKNGDLRSITVRKAVPKTNTQNPNEQNRNTNTPNGANYTNPLQNEFENSATYRVIHKVGDKVTESVNNLDGEKISREVQGAVNGVVNEVSRVAEAVRR